MGVSFQIWRNGLIIGGMRLSLLVPFRGENESRRDAYWSGLYVANIIHGAGIIHFGKRKRGRFRRERTRIRSYIVFNIGGRHGF